MSVETKGGLKICKLDAEIIRYDVREALKAFGKVPSSVAKKLRRRAIIDANLHKIANPSFSHGGGPAVEQGQTPRDKKTTV